MLYGDIGRGPDPVDVVLRQKVEGPDMPCLSRSAPPNENVFEFCSQWTVSHVMVPIQQDNDVFA